MSQPDTLHGRLLDLVARLPADQQQAAEGWTRLLTDVAEAPMLADPIADRILDLFGLAPDSTTTPPADTGSCDPPGRK